MLARVPLPSGALAAVAAQLKQYITAREQRLLAVADKATTPAASDDQLAQQWQVRHWVCVPHHKAALSCMSCTIVVPQACLKLSTQAEHIRNDMLYCSAATSCSQSFQYQYK